MVRTSSVAVGRDSVRVCSRTAVVDCTVGRRVGEDLDIDLEFVLDEVAIGNGIDSGAAAGMDGNAGVCAGTGLEADVDADSHEFVGGGGVGDTPGDWFGAPVARSCASPGAVADTEGKYAKY